MSRACAVRWPYAFRTSDEFSVLESHHIAHVRSRTQCSRGRDQYAQDLQMSIGRGAKIATVNEIVSRFPVLPVHWLDSADLGFAASRQLSGVHRSWRQR